MNRGPLPPSTPYKIGRKSAPSWICYFGHNHPTSKARRDCEKRNGRPR